MGETGRGFRCGIPSGDAGAECCGQRRDQAEAGACARPQCAETSISVAQAALQRRAPRSHVQR